MSPIFLYLSACAGSPVLSAEPTPAPRAEDGQASVHRTVDCAGGADFTSIQDAIDAATDGDEIAVEPCTYDENLDFGGKRVALYGTGDRDQVVVSGGRNSAVVTAASGEPEGTSLSNLTLEGGGGGSGAISVTLSALSLQNVLSTGSNGSYALYSYSGDIELVDVEFEDPSASYAVIYASRGNFVGDGLSLACGGGAGIISGHGAFYLGDSVVDCGRGTALSTEHSTGQIVSSLLSGNIAMVQEDDHPEDTIRMENVVVEGNISQQYGSFNFRNSVVVGGISLSTVDVASAIEASVITGASCGISTDVTGFTVRYSDFWDNQQDSCSGEVYVGEDDNLGADPEFVDAGGGDYSLAAGSRLIDAGPPDDGWEDVDGSRNDIGAFGGRHSIGGGW